MEIGLLLSLAVAFAFQTVFFQIAVRAKNGLLFDGEPLCFP
jgi:hypothetical protein